MTRFNPLEQNSPFRDGSRQRYGLNASGGNQRTSFYLSGDHEEVCVCHLHGALELPQPTVSRHLAYLRKHGLVAGRKEGLWVHYRLARPRSGLHRILLGCLGSCLGDPEVFAQDRQRLEGLLGCCGGP